jgi:hypothetical protein
VTNITSEELAVIGQETTKEAPDSKQSARSFVPIKGTKKVLTDPSSSKGKVVCTGTSLSPK